MTRAVISWNPAWTIRSTQIISRPPAGRGTISVPTRLLQSRTIRNAPTTPARMRPYSGTITTSPLNRRVDRDLGRDVRVSLQPVPRERAGRHDGQPLAGRVPDRRAHELAADAVAFQRPGHAGMQQDHPVAAAPVHKLRNGGACAVLEPGMVWVVGYLW